jgi:hypothetical protein
MAKVVSVFDLAFFHLVLGADMGTLGLFAVDAKPFNVLLTARSIVGLCWMILRGLDAIVSV